MDLTECALCNEQYDESKHRARNLSCGHYYCQDCLDQVIKSSSPRCPSCRADISAHSADMLLPNFLMDNLIIKMKAGTVLVDSKAKVEEQLEDFSAGTCPKHKECKLYFTCMSHKIKICRDCTVLDHNPSRCQIISFEDEIKETKESNISNLETQKSKREKNIKDLQYIINNNEATIQEHQEEVERLHKKVKESKQIVDKANVGIRDCKENKSRLESIQQELVSSITINQINQSCQKAENIIRASNSLGISMETKITGFQDLTDQNCVNTVLQGKVTAHATADVNGEKRFAQLMVKNGDVHMPALASCSSPPASNNTVTVSSLLTRYTNTDIYLTLASGGKEMGTVYIKLWDNDFTKYIRRIFMGTIGPCYRGAVFDNKGNSWLATGAVSKYDASRCTDPAPALPVSMYSKKGLVYITDTTGLGFWFSGGGHLPIVGDVINGMSVLEEAHNYPSGKVSITDAGIVLK